jgi:uncharacterized protein (DUF697 family)
MANTSLVERVQQMVRGRLLQAYHTVQVDPGRFLLQLREAHGLQVSSYRDLRTVDVRVLDSVARSTIRGARKIAAVEGAGLGFGGMLTLLPDVGILAAISVRTVQKLSLIYGFEYTTDEEQSELWLALATAAGVDVTRELVEKGVLERFVPRVVERIAAKVGVEIAEKWVGRIVPVLSSGIGATLNYYFVKAWGERAMRHFRAKNIAFRALPAPGPLLADTPTLQLPG